MSRLGGASRVPFLFARNSAQEVLTFGRDSRMNSKPIIAVNADFRPASAEHIALTWLPSGYFDQISGAKTTKSPGGIPMIVPPLAEEDDLRALLENCDGVLLAGCSLDLDPRRLGFDKHPATKPMATRREDFDRRLARMAVEMRLPILAIGAGMQTVNVVCGGTLFQHIPEDFPKAIQHRDHVERTLRHIINIVPGTRMDVMYGPGEIRVNSDHHMCVDQLAPVFKASATAPDGVIEAFESVDDDWFCVGVQWHPESDTAAALDMQAFEIFLEACVDRLAGTGTETAPMTIPFTQKVSRKAVAAA